MRHFFFVVVALTITLSLPFAAASQQADMAPQAKVAALSDFSDRVRRLEQMASDIALAASLSVLTIHQPGLQFDSEGKWSGKVRTITNDLGDVTATTGYALPKMRGKLVKNAMATDAQTLEAREIFDALKGLIVQADALNKLIAAGDADAAVKFLASDALATAQDIRARADTLSGEAQLAIKLAGI